MIPAVVRVTPTDSFRLLLEFDNGEAGILDVQPWLDFGVFRRLRDPDVFRQVRVAWDTIQWDCGVDLDPELLHARAVRPPRSTDRG